MQAITYFVQRADGDIKIGTSHLEIFRERLEGIRRKSGAIMVLGVMDGGYELETALHVQFAEYRRMGKRWQISEWFAPAAALFAFIEQNAKPLPDSVPMRRSRLVMIDRGANCVPELLRAKWGSETVNLYHVASETGLCWHTVRAWSRRWVTRVHPDVAAAWCAYFGCSFEELVKRADGE